MENVSYPSPIAAESVAIEIIPHQSDQRATEIINKVNDDACNNDTAMESGDDVVNEEANDNEADDLGLSTVDASSMHVSRNSQTIPTSSRVEIFWDGDNAFYSGTVIRYEESSGNYIVVYDGEDTSEYAENLNESSWRYAKVMDPSQMVGSKTKKSQAARNTGTSGGGRITYAQMVIDAVEGLGDKNGSSIMAIRKYMLNKFDVKQQHAASFNALTLKAINAAEATLTLEKVSRGVYRISAVEKERRKDAERKQLQDAKQVEKMKLSKIKQDAKAKEMRMKEKARMERLRESAKNKSSSGASRGGDDSGLLAGNNVLMRSSVFDREFASYRFREQLVGTAAESNKQLRKEYEKSRLMRDDFLRTCAEVLEPFISERHTVLKSTAAVASSDAVNNDAVPMEVEESANDPLIEPATSANIEEKGEGKVTEEVAEMEAAEAVEEIEEIEEIEEMGVDVATDVIEVLDEPLTGALKNVDILPQSSTLKAELHVHQVQGISWMVHMFQKGMPMILGDQMGLGKTIQSIGFLAALHEQFSQRGPHLVVVPLSVLSNWLAEIERFCPSFRAVRFHGPKNERNRIKAEELNDLAEFDIVVTTFEMLVSEANFFRRRFMWTTLIVDEGHRLKNEKSQLSEKLRAVPSLCKVILTGTPLQNNLRELWAMLHFLAPDLFPPSTAENFEDGFDLTRNKIDAGVLRKARKLLALFMLRRVKDDVKISLPSKKELTFLVPLTDQQVSWYKQLLYGMDESMIEAVMKVSTSSSSQLERSDAGDQEAASAVPDEPVVKEKATVGRKKKSEVSTGAESAVVNGSSSSSSSSSANPQTPGDGDWRRLMNLLLQLRKVCNHVYLMPSGAPDPYEVTEQIVGGSGKLQLLDRMLPMLRQDGHRILLFSQFTIMLDILEDYCELRGYPFVRLDGNTNRVQRRLDVRRFNAPNSQLFIFLISTRAGGLGLNLASADTVILYDSDWNPQVDLQAMERAHRIGQVKPVRIFRLVCRGSVEERMVSRADKKLFLNAMVAEADPDADVTEGSGTANAEVDIANALGVGGASVSKQELASLIRFGANAIIESSSAQSQISDKELDVLLERSGRDKLIVPAAAELDNSGDPTATLEDQIIQTPDFELQQKLLLERLEKIQEVDIRQLGSMVYNKKKTTRKEDLIKRNARQILSGNFNDNDNAVEDTDAWIEPSAKRQRKERIIMVDGRGTGYGGAVPMLADSMDKVSSNAPSTLTRRGRSWSHQTFCCLCGKSKGLDKEAAPVEQSQGVAGNAEKGKKATAASTPVSKQVAAVPVSGLPDITSSTKCAHCPKRFHDACLWTHGIDGDALKGTYICNHHKCAGCGRNTASAGGLLFRCVDCLTAYCEDCLPQDEIESLGRCKELEEVGYEPSQSYYIRCPGCIEFSSEKAAQPVADTSNAVFANVADVEATEQVEISQLLPTQRMRVIWNEVLEVVVPAKKFPKRNKSQKPLVESNSDEETEEDSGAAKSEGNNLKKKDEKQPTKQPKAGSSKLPNYSIKIPKNCSLAKGLRIVMDHPEACSIVSALDEADLGSRLNFSNISSKVDNERYRSTEHFIADVVAVFDQLKLFLLGLSKKLEKNKLDSVNADSIEATLAALSRLTTYVKIVLADKLTM